MKKSLGILLTIVSSCSGFVEVFRGPKKITFYELAGQMDQALPKKRTYLAQPEIVGALAAGVLTTLYGKPAVQPVVATVAPSVQTRSNSLMMNIIMLGLGLSISGFGVYTFMGHEMGVIVNFKSTLKKLTAQIADWQKIINDMQINQSHQEEKLAQAQLQIQKMLPLMQELVKQSGNEQILAKTISHLYLESAAMVDRIKSLEDTIVTINKLAKETTPEAKEAKNREVKKLIIKSNNIFGQPIQQSTAYWLPLKKVASAF